MDVLRGGCRGRSPRRSAQRSGCRPSNPPDWDCYRRSGCTQSRRPTGTSTRGRRPGRSSGFRNRQYSTRILKPKFTKFTISIRSCAVKEIHFLFNCIEDFVKVTAALNGLRPVADAGESVGLKFPSSGQNYFIINCQVVVLVVVLFVVLVVILVAILEVILVIVEKILVVVLVVVLVAVLVVVLVVVEIMLVILVVVEII